jgi:hypothetical protein
LRYAGGYHPQVSDEQSNEQNPERTWMICGTCGYPLELKTPREGDRQWLHVREDARDHVVVPVDAADIEFNSRCDFCDREQATEIVLCDSFIVPDTPSRSIGHWAACEQCAEMVRRRRWSQLVTYVRAASTPARPPARCCWASTQRSSRTCTGSSPWASGRVAAVTH